MKWLEKICVETRSKAAVNRLVYKGLRREYPRKFAQSEGRSAMTANAIVKALDRGVNPALRTFPWFSCHIGRHFALISES